MGSPAHQALIARVTGGYAGDPRVLAVVVFGSVSTGTWHELSDVDLDVATTSGRGRRWEAILARLGLD